MLDGDSEAVGEPILGGAGADGPPGYTPLHLAGRILRDPRRRTQGDCGGLLEPRERVLRRLEITGTAVMTDNGACCRSHVFAAALGADVKRKWTKPYRPQTNGKAERLDRTLAAA